MSSFGVTTNASRASHRRPGCHIASLALLSMLPGCALVERLMGEPPPVQEASGSGEVDAGPTWVLETEPNDSLAQAPSAAADSAWRGTLARGDVDVVRLGMGAPVSLAVTSTDAATLTLQYPGMGIRQSWPVAAGVPLVLPGVVRDDALAVELSGAGDWELQFGPAQVVEPPCGLAREDDGPEAPGAEFVAIPSRVTGCIATAGDVDTFVIAADALTNTPMFGLSVESAEDLSLQVTLRDSANQVMAELIGGPGESLLVPNVGLPLTPGPVTITVSSLDGASPTASYQLEVRRPPGVLGAVEVEPNDTSVAATAVLSIDIINGYVHRAGDVDYYRVVPEESQVLRLVADAPPGVDLQIQLEEGSSFGPTVVNGAAAGEDETLCSVRVGPEAPLSFAINAIGPETTGMAPYVLRFDRYAGADFEVEPNDGPELLPPTEPLVIAEESIPVGFLLAPGIASRTAAGHIFPMADRDHVALEVAGDPAAAVTYTSVTLRLEPGPTADLVLELLDATGAVVARTNAAPLGMPETIAVDLASGRYIARVTRFAGESCREPWRLSVDQTAIPLPPDPFVPAEGSGEGSGAPALPAEGSVGVPAFPDVNAPGAEPTDLEPELPRRPGAQVDGLPGRPNRNRTPVPDDPRPQGSRDATLTPRGEEPGALAPR